MTLAFSERRGAPFATLEQQILNGIAEEELISAHGTAYQQWAASLTIEHAREQLEILRMVANA